MNVWNEFEKIYCINLPEDIIRKEHIENEFNKFNISTKINYIAANRPPSNYTISNYRFSGEFGCALSHSKALINAVHCKKPILIVEDDAIFSKDTEIILVNTIKNFPDNWSIIYIGGKPTQKLTKYNEYICKIGSFVQTVAYIVNPKHITDILEFIVDNITNEFPNACIDKILSDYTLLTNSGYCTYPPLVTQKDGYSTLRLARRAYTSDTLQHWKKYKP